MNNRYRRIVTGLAALLGAYAGVWATLFPRSFYDGFPGFGRAWVSVDGPFNEHLIRDVGGLYLGLVAASIWAIFRSELIATRIVGLAWTLYGVIHFAYHASHLSEYALIDAVGNVVTLGGSLVLGILMFLPEFRHRQHRPQAESASQ